MSEEKSITFTPGQNLFEPFESKADAAVKHFKTQLLMCIVIAFRESNRTRHEFAERGKTTLTRLNKILEGDLSNISTEELIKIIINIGGASAAGFNPETNDVVFTITGRF